MMRLRKRIDTAPVIPTASMADIAFLLIVFFMVTITFEKDKTQVVLPKTELRFEVPKEAAYISITDLGQIRVTTGEEMSSLLPLEDVVSFASNVVQRFPDRPFVIKADGEVPYRNIDKIIDALKQAKVELIYLLSDQKASSNVQAAEAASGG